MPEEQAKSVGELMSIRDVEGIDLPDGNTGEGLKFTTNRGDFKAILHRAPDTDKAVIWVCGARGGFGGPGPGTRASSKVIQWYRQQQVQVQYLIVI